MYVIKVSNFNERKHVFAIFPMVLDDFVCLVFAAEVWLGGFIVYYISKHL